MEFWTKAKAKFENAANVSLVMIVLYQLIYMISFQAVNSQCKAINARVIHQTQVTINVNLKGKQQLEKCPRSYFCHACTMIPCFF